MRGYWPGRCLGTRAGEIIGAAFSYDDVVDAIETLLTTYVSVREPGERFIETYRRLGAVPFKEALYAGA